MKPLISIIVPIYNSEKYLDRCVKSILSQTYENIELILVNDGSTDNSLNICNKYKLLDTRVNVVDKENGGVSSARNFGLDIATGDFIGFVDSDDYINSNMYSHLIEDMADDSDLVVLLVHTINPTELFQNNLEFISGKEALFYLFQLKFPTSLWAYLYRKNIIDNIRLNRNIHFFEDFEFNSKILIKSQKVYLCRSSLYNYEINETSINNQKINCKKITCLEIYGNLIKLPYIRNNPDLMKYSEYFRSHFLISIIISLSNSIYVADKKYFMLVKQNSKEILENVISSQYVPIKYKFIIMLVSVMPKLTIRCIFIIKKFINQINTCN